MQNDLSYELYLCVDFSYSSTNRLRIYVGFCIDIFSKVNGLNPGVSVVRVV